MSGAVVAIAVVCVNAATFVLLAVALFIEFGGAIFLPGLNPAPVTQSTLSLLMLWGLTLTMAGNLALLVLASVSLCLNRCRPNALGVAPAPSGDDDAEGAVRL